MTAEKDPGLMADIAALTHPGKVREGNEDCLGIGDWISCEALTTPRIFRQILGSVPLLCVVADGMGGHAAGEVASHQATEQLLAMGVRLSLLASCWVDCLREIHTALFARMDAMPVLRSMGTTVAGLALTEDQALVFNIGDSRVYRGRDGFLTQLSTDDVRHAHYGQSDGHSRNHALSQCLGGPIRSAIDPHSLSLRLAIGDFWLLTSDGITDLLDIDVLEAAITPNDPARTVAILAEQALAAGGLDNLSLIAVRIHALNDGFAS
ncbi:MAG: PP2C family serine/threonine-protein phosphatase [Pseudomonadota bacterium]